MTFTDAVEKGMDGVLSPLRRPTHTRRVLATFPRLAERLGHQGAQLSGGEQQMLSIGRALTTHPALAGFLGV